MPTHFGFYFSCHLNYAVTIYFIIGYLQNPIQFNAHVNCLLFPLTTFDFLNFYLKTIPSSYSDICSFHGLISLYQCCKPQVALGYNAIVSLNFVSSFILIFFSFDFFISQTYYELFLVSSFSYFQFSLLFTKFVVHLLLRFWLSFISKIVVMYFRKEWSRIHLVPNIKKTFWFLF